MVDDDRMARSEAGLGFAEEEMAIRQKVEYLDSSGTLAFPALHACICLRLQLLLCCCAVARCLTCLRWIEGWMEGWKDRRKWLIFYFILFIFSSLSVRGCSVVEFTLRVVQRWVLINE